MPHLLLPRLPRDSTPRACLHPTHLWYTCNFTWLTPQPPTFSGCCSINVCKTPDGICPDPISEQTATKPIITVVATSTIDGAATAATFFITPSAVLGPSHTGGSSSSGGGESNGRSTTTMTTMIITIASSIAAVAGAIIIGFIVWFILRQRKRTRRTRELGLGLYLNSQFPQNPMDFDSPLPPVYPADNEGFSDGEYTAYHGAATQPPPATVPGARKEKKGMRWSVFSHSFEAPVGTGSPLIELEGEKAVEVSELSGETVEELPGE